MSSFRKTVARVLPPRFKNRLKIAFPTLVSRPAETSDTSSIASAANTVGDRAKLTGKSLVSVIVPVYNVEDYLEECLESIVKQSYKNLQILLINDGSTDGSLDIARAFAKRDKRIRVITKENAGLGAARNTGVENATGKYIVFSDSDDIIPKDAYKDMLTALEHSGSDFVTGTIYRFSKKGRDVPLWCQKLHAENRYGITIEEYAEGLVNVYAVNKMYRRTFWDRLEMGYPEGVRYEDQEPSTKIFLLAKKFDVIHADVYGYRQRDDNSSITQNKHLIKDVEDRLNVVKSTAEVVLNHASPQIREAWISKILRYDLMPYVRTALDSDENYRQHVYELCKFIYEAGKQYGYAEAPVKVRAAVSAVLSHSWDSLAEAILFNDEMGSHLRATFEGGKLYLDSPIIQNIEEQYRAFGLLLTEDESKIVGVAQCIYGVDENELVIVGSAIVKTLDTGDSQESVQLKVWAVNLDTNIRVPARIQRRRHDWTTRWAQGRWCDYDGAGFEARVNVLGMRSTLGSNFSVRDTSRWEILIEASYQGLVRYGKLDRVMGGSFASVQGSELELAGRHVTWQLQNGVIEFSVASSDITLSINRTQDKVLVLEAAGLLSRQISTAKIVRRGHSYDVPTHVAPGTTSSLLAIPIDKLNENCHESWNLEVYGKNGDLLDITLASGAEAERYFNGDFLLTSSSRNRVQITSNPPVLSVSSFELDETHLIVRGISYSQDIENQPAALYIQSGALTSPHAPISWQGGVFTALVDLRNEDENAPYLPYLGFSLRHLDGQGRDRAVRLTSDVFKQVLPMEGTTSNYRLRASVTKFGNTWINLSAPLDDTEFGPYQQKRLQEQFARLEVDVDPQIVVFNAYLGERVTDSASQIASDLLTSQNNLELYWTVSTPAVQVPDGVRKIVQNTSQWYELLARAGTIFQNIYFDPWFTRREGQRFVQTWHGTPLKTVGRSYWEQIGRSTSWIDRMTRQAQSWTHLISPSRYTSEILVKETGFTGELLEIGYPRNDVLAREEQASRIRQYTREKLGIQDWQKVVLYAPTWRESLAKQSWKAAMVNFIDMPTFEKQLGSGYVTLVRGHGHNERFGSKTKESANVKDVTTYPEINDLYLAADVIITDYSSVMFDAVVAKKPLVFFVPDLESYMNSGRGMYTDLRRIAPGPVLFEQHELVDVILDTPELETMVHSRKYQEFIAEYAPFDDGFAGSRAVERLWPLKSGLQQSSTSLP